MNVAEFSTEFFNSYLVRIIDIGLFFITLETPNGEELTLPNNLFIQKSIKKVVPPAVDDSAGLKTEG
jgi:small-conductance mechanosensitive channel